MLRRGMMSLLGAALATACASPPLARPTRVYSEDRLERHGNALAQGCSPGMSCFGHVVVLPNGEVAEAAVEATAAAAAAAAAAATTTATMQSEKAKPAKAEEKSAEKADAKTRLKRKVTCEIRGGTPKQPDPKKRIRCSYRCPGDPPGIVHDIELDLPLCPQLWDFYL